jgi:hypothetical protein
MVNLTRATLTLVLLLLIQAITGGAFAGPHTATKKWFFM